jgi:hypothetical protein
MAAGLSVEQGVDLKLASRRVKIQEILDLNLREAPHQHAALTARVRVKGRLAEALSAVGRGVEAMAFDGRAFRPLFRGTVDEIDFADSCLTISALGPTHERDEAVHTRTFGEADRLTPVHQLRGMRELLAGVKSAGKLTHAAPVVWQFAATDFALLRRLADLHGLMVLTSALENQATLTDGGDGPTVPVPAAWVMPGSEQVTARRGPAADARCLTWKVLSGDMPDKPARPEPPDAGGLFADILKGAAAGGGAASVVHAASLGGAGDDVQLATRLARAHRAHLVRYRATLNYHGRDVAVGSRIRLEGHPLTEELFVARRCLRYRPDAGAPEAQFTNEIECTPAAAPPLGAVLPTPGAAVVLLGRCLDIDDPLHLARVKAACPWHGATGRAGVWCPMPQPFGGTTEGRHAGAASLPAVGDWVVLLADPTGFDPPLVLGSVYPGSSAKGAKKQAPPPSPPRERVLFRTASGAELVVLEPHDGKPMAVTLGIRGADGSDVCRIRLSADGKIDAFGSDLHFRSKSLEAESKCRVKGSLNVTKG